MKIKTSYPRQIREIENTWIPLSDGTRLAARIWLPEDAETDPVPALLEYLPYRKDDGTLARDSIRHPYFAGHGYASIRVDMRGSGDSDGILYDEYLPQEQADALEVLRWIAAQPWCTGAVGMFGISWGGFNSLQVAAHRPPELKAIITLCSTDDRYADDVHYMGGCVLACEMLSWASTMLAYNACPPHPHLVSDRWRDMWFERMEKSPPFVEAWLSHQRRDAFWQQGSVCENYADITCAVYAVGGWADAYTNAIPRLLAGLTCPKKGLIGPWAHNYPNAGKPGPAIGFQQECLRWWDHWLKGIDTGIMEEPMLRAWMQGSVPPSAGYAEMPGRWVAESAWPSPEIGEHSLWLNAPGVLAASPADETPLEYEGTLAHGHDAGVWCPYGVNGDFPPDQRAEDGLSLCFTSAPLEAPLEILGNPEVTLTLAVDRPTALVAVRLCDVRPDGASLLVSRGLLNLTHREGHEAPVPLEPGQRYTVTFPLNVCGHSLPAGHRWRLAVSPCYWPFAWPSPEPVRLTLFTGSGCRLTLPARAPRPEDDALPSFEEAEGSAPLAASTLHTGRREMTVEHDQLTGLIRFTDRSDQGMYRQTATQIERGNTSLNEHTVIVGQPLSAAARCERSVTIARGEWRTRVETVSTMSADAHNFHLTNTLEAFEGEARVFAKTWSTTIPRDGV
jgi:putative CocE/NonD family hydrolase